MSFPTYQVPKPKKKSYLKGEKLDVKPASLSALRGAGHALVGVLWGGRAWIRDKITIKLLQENGSYGNRLTLRKNNVIADVTKIEDVVETQSDAVPSLSKDIMINAPQPKSPRSPDGDGIEPPKKKLKSARRLIEGFSLDPAFSASVDALSIFQAIRECQIPVSGEAPFSLATDIAQNRADYLHLLGEEAFYLCHNGCLSLYDSLIDEASTPLPLTAIWSHLVSEDKRFPEKYVAYRHFVTHGWVPKCGLKFGADYLLYKTGPSVYHSSFAVKVQRCPADEAPSNGRNSQKDDKGMISAQSEEAGNKDLATDTEKSIDMKISSESMDMEISSGSCQDANTLQTSLPAQRKDVITWQDVMALGRVNEASKKDIIICSVYANTLGFQSLDDSRPFGASPDDINVECIIATRWVAEKERE